MTQSNNEAEENFANGRQEAGMLMEIEHGPVIGHFTLSRPASEGSHPEEVRAAWVGVALPVRRDAKCDEGVVEVYCIDGFNKLVEAEVDQTVLQYWVDTLDGRAGLRSSFLFNPEDGGYVVDQEAVSRSDFLKRSAGKFGMTGYVMFASEEE